MDREVKRHLIENQATPDLDLKAPLYHEGMSLKSRLKIARGERTQAWLAEKLKVSVQAVSQWETGKTAPGADRIRQIAEVTGSDFHWLLDGTVRPGPHPVGEGDRMIWRAPLIDDVAAGRWTETPGVQHLAPDTRYLDVYDKPVGDLFALRVVGESMEPDFKSGDVIILDTGAEPIPGDFVVAKLDNQLSTTFKKFRPREYDGEGLALAELVPLNSDYPTLMISPDSPGVIIGVMVEHRRFRKRR